MIDSIIPGSYMIAIVDNVYFNPPYTNKKTGEVTEAAWKAQIKTAVLKGEDTQKRELNDINLKMDQSSVKFFKENLGKLVVFQFGTYSMKDESGRETSKGFTLKQGTRLYTVGEFANELYVPRETKPAGVSVPSALNK